MKPTCLTPGCVLPFDHTVAHSKSETEPYAGFREPYMQTQGVSTTDLLGSTLGIGLATGSGAHHGPPTPPVTLEGLAAVIGAASQALGTMYAMNNSDHGDNVSADLVALSAKARELACGKEEKEMTAGDAVRSVHQRVAAMTPDEAERHAEAIAARDDAELVAVNATYNRAITDAQAALRHLFGPETPANPSTARAQEALQRLFRSTP